MGSFPVIVPPSPGLLCALGDLVADFRNEFARTLIRLTARGDRRRRSTASSTSSRAARASGWTRRASPPTQQIVSFVADMRYHGQGYEIPVADRATTSTRSRALQRPARAALRLPHAGHGVGDRQPARGRHRRPAEARAAASGDAAPAPSTRRDPLRGRAADADLRPRPRCSPGNRLAGPAVDHRVRLHHGRAARLRGRGRPLLQHPDPAGGRSHERDPTDRRRSPTSRSTRSRSTSSRTPCATRASRWTPCSSAAP